MAHSLDITMKRKRDAFSSLNFKSKKTKMKFMKKKEKEVVKVNALRPTKVLRLSHRSNVVQWGTVVPALLLHFPQLIKQQKGGKIGKSTK